MKWVARCQIFDRGIASNIDLSPTFDNIYDCQDYIDKNLQVLEYLLSEVQSFYDRKVLNKLVFRFGNHIRCYCVSQNRFCEGMDF